MTVRLTAGILLLAGLFLAMAGSCYRSPDTTWHEPHVYKGSSDPLVDKLKEGGLHTRLEERFQAVQTDR